MTRSDQGAIARMGYSAEDALREADEAARRGDFVAAADWSELAEVYSHYAFKRAAL